jgi:hypothetical protein
MRPEQGVDMGPTFGREVSDDMQDRLSEQLENFHDLDSDAIERDDKQKHPSLPAAGNGDAYRAT